MKRSVFKSFLTFLAILITVSSFISVSQASSTDCSKYFSESSLFYRMTKNIDHLQSEFDKIQSTINMFLASLKDSTLSLEQNIRLLIEYLSTLENFNNTLYSIKNTNPPDQVLNDFIQKVQVKKSEILETIFLDKTSSSLIKKVYTERFNLRLDASTLYQIQKLYSVFSSYINFSIQGNDSTYSKKIFDLKKRLSLPLSFSTVFSHRNSTNSLSNFLEIFNKDINDLLLLEQEYIQTQTGSETLFDYVFRNSALKSKETFINSILNIVFPTSIYRINESNYTLPQRLAEKGSINVKGNTRVSIIDTRRIQESQKSLLKQILTLLFSKKSHRIRTYDAIEGILSVLSNMYQLNFRIDDDSTYGSAKNSFIIHVCTYPNNKFLGVFHINLDKIFLNSTSLTSATKEKTSNDGYLSFHSLHTLVHYMHRSVFNLINRYGILLQEPTSKEFDYLLDIYMDNIFFSYPFLSKYLKKEDGSPIESDTLNNITELYTTSSEDIFIYTFLSIQEYILHNSSTFDGKTYLTQVKDTMEKMLNPHYLKLYIEPDFEAIPDYIYNHTNIDSLDNSLRLLAHLEALNLIQFLSNNNYSAQSFNQVKAFLLNGGKDFRTVGIPFTLAPFFDMSYRVK